MFWNKKDTGLVGTLPWYSREQLASGGLVFIPDPRTEEELGRPQKASEC